MIAYLMMKLMGRLRFQLVVNLSFMELRVLDTIPSSLLNSYFCVQIDGKTKYIHKQTACWILTDSNSHLSADRLR